MKKISSYKELQEERRSSRQKLVQLELLIKEDIEEIKESLQPVRLAGQTVKKMVSSDRDGLLSESIGLTVDTLIRKFILRRANWIFRIGAAFLLKNYAKNVVAKNSDNIVGWLLSKIKKKKDNHSAHFTHGSTTSDVEWDT